MRRLAFIITLLLLCRVNAVAQQEATVYDSLKSYFEAISTMPVDSICNRLDILIGSATDDDVRARIAGRAFDYYMDCPVMGAEGVSVYIADNYFLNKRLEWPSGATLPNLYAFAEFNRQSLLGMPAAELTLESLEGGLVDVREASGAYKILYFYEDACSTCARQTPLLVSLLKEYSGTIPVSLYAVYTQSDRAAWAKYAISHFGQIDNPKVRVFNLWDPDGVSGFHKKYSVLSTPSLLLLDADGRIIGRRLDVAALARLLEQEESFTASLYSLMDGVRDNIGLGRESIADVCEAFSSRIGGDAGLYRNTFLGIYNYLRGQGDYRAQESAAFVAQEYILDRPGVWSSEMLAQIAEAVRRFNLNPPGSKAADIILKTRCGRDCRLLEKRGKKFTVLFFNLVSCTECTKWRSELRAMAPLLRRSGAKVISVYVGPDLQEWKKATRGCSHGWVELRAEWPGSELYRAYDVSVAPKLYLLDGEGTVLAKEISPETLSALLQE